MAKVNSAMRKALQNQASMQASFRRLNQFAREIGGANNPAVDASSKVLIKGLKKVLGDRGSSAPGQPPRKRSGRLQKSIGREVVGGVMRVGSGHFTAPILEFGAVMSAKTAHRRRHGKRIGQMTRATSARVIEPRPFMERGLETAKPEMIGVSVTALKKKSEELAT